MDIYREDKFFSFSSAATIEMGWIQDKICILLYVLGSLTFGFTICW